MVLAVVRTLDPGLEMTMKNNRHTRAQDRLKDRSDIGAVEFPIEKLVRLRDAGACCVHIEAAMETERNLLGLIKDRSHRTAKADQPRLRIISRHCSI